MNEPSVSEWLRWRISRDWKTALLALGVAGLVIAASRHVGPKPVDPRTEVTARITGFTPPVSRFSGNAVVITASAGGIYGSRTVPFDSVAGCKVGDTVRAVRSNGGLTLYPMPCRNPQPGA